MKNFQYLDINVDQLLKLHIKIEERRESAERVDLEDPVFVVFLSL